MEEKEKKNKRIRYPKKVKQGGESKEQLNMHYTLQVHDSNVDSKSKIGN